jgi:hypothetical protein
MVSKSSGPRIIQHFLRSLVVDSTTFFVNKRFSKGAKASSGGAAAE